MPRHPRIFVALGLVLALAPSAWAGGTKVALKRRYNPSAPALGQGALVTTPQNTQHLDETHYQSVRDASLAMMKLYPPANHYYVALGRSPVSIYSFLHALDPNITSVFPASDLRITNPATFQEQFNQHFEKYIPAEVLRGERGSIVFFDRSHDQSGSSLQVLKPVLENYLRQKGYPTKVVMLGMANKGPLKAGVDFMSISHIPKVFLYFGSGSDHDENVATYTGKHTVGTHSVDQLTANPTFDTFHAQMKARMERDKTLDDALTQDATFQHVLSAE